MVVFEKVSDEKTWRVCVQCKKKHVTVCLEFSNAGSCPRGGRCPLRHTAKKRRLYEVPSSSPNPDWYGCVAFYQYSVFELLFKLSY